MGMTKSLRPPTLEEVQGAAERLAPFVSRTPLVRLQSDGPSKIFLKLENLHPIGSFKIRPAGSAIAQRIDDTVDGGVYTASSGNMAQGVAFVARALGIPATVLLTNNAAATKVAGLERLGARIRYLSDTEWWDAIHDHGHPDERGLFVHPVASRDVLAGDATVGLEIYEQLPEVDTVLVPFGGGGLATGIASAMRALKPSVLVLGAESDHCAPLTAAIEAGEPVETTIRPSFLQGIGVGRVLGEMWPLVKDLLAGAVVAQEREIVDAIRFLCERHHVIAEGAGAAGVASALAGRASEGNVVCVVSGGNLDRDDLLDILRGRTPAAALERSSRAFGIMDLRR